MITELLLLYLYLCVVGAPCSRRKMVDPAAIQLANTDTTIVWLAAPMYSGSPQPQK